MSLSSFPVFLHCQIYKMQDINFWPLLTNSFSVVYLRTIIVLGSLQTIETPNLKINNQMDFLWCYWPSCKFFSFVFSILLFVLSGKNKNKNKKHFLIVHWHCGYDSLLIRIISCIQSLLIFFKNWIGGISLLLCSVLLLIGHNYGRGQTPDPGEARWILSEIWTVGWHPIF